MRKLLLALCFIYSAVNAQWTNSTVFGSVIANTNLDQEDQVLVEDGSGGAIIFWTEDDSWQKKTIRYNRVNGAGRLVWGSSSDGKLLINSAYYYYRIEAVVADGLGGAYILFMSSSIYSIGSPKTEYLQHISATGQKLIADEGITFDKSLGFSSCMIADGLGGIIIAYTEADGTAAGFTRIQRFSSSGQALWSPAAGIRITENAGNGAWDIPSSIIADGEGNFIISFIDSRYNGYTPVNNGFFDRDIFIQKLSVSGQQLWKKNGVPVCTNAAQQNLVQQTARPDDPSITPSICSDGKGGAYVVWFDFRNSPSNDPSLLNLYAQHISTSGSALWSENGIPITDRELISDYSVFESEVGFTVIWNDNTLRKTKIQILSENGSKKLDGSGKVIITEFGLLRYSTPSVGHSDLIIAYTEILGDGFLIQRLNLSNGVLAFDKRGRRISDSGFNPYIVSDGGDGAIVTWNQFSNFISNVQANHIGYDGIQPTSISSFSATLGSENVVLSWNTTAEVNTSHFIIERSIDGLQFTSIDSVNAKGNSIDLHTYSYNDPLANIAISSGSTIYYRLQIVYSDGKRNKSRVVSIHLSELPAQITARLLGNPVGESLRVLISAKEDNVCSLTWYKQNGNIVGARTGQLSQGENYVTIFVGSLSKGIYFLKITTPSDNQTIKFVKE